jgi:Holliday junction resolvase RusA-like endonuclease
MTLTFSIIGTPAPQGSKTRNRYGAVYESSAKVKPWRQDVRAAALDAIESADDLLAPDGLRFPTGPVIVGIRFRLARPKGHYGTGRNAGQLRPSAPKVPDVKPDIDKLVRSTLDGMGEAGVWRDDCQVVGLWVVKEYATDDLPVGATVSVEAHGSWMGAPLLSVVR